MTTMVISYSHENFSELRRFWREYERQGDAAATRGTSREETLRWGGRLQVLRWEDETPVADARLPLATGLARDGDTILACSYDSITRFDESLRAIESFSDPMFCNLHGIARHGDAWLVCSTGIDAVLRWRPGERARPWWTAGNAGFDRTPTGARRLVDYSEDHRGRFYPTIAQTTHVNGVTPVGSASALLTLFHQGVVVQTDGVHTEQMVATLHCPHSPRMRVDGTFYCADSANRRIVEWRADRSSCIDLTPHCEWIQDAVWLESSSTYLAADSNHYRLVNVDPTGALVGEHAFPNDWRVHQILVLSETS